MRRPLDPPSLYVLLVALLLTASTLAAPTTVRAEPAPPSGFRALTGAQARAFRLPEDTAPILDIRLGRLGLTLERHQQYVGRAGAAVEGGQLTLVRRSGEALLVIGAHYPGLSLGRQTLIDESRALLAAMSDDSLEAEHDGRAPTPPGEWRGREQLQHRSGLWLDPASGRAYYRVETRGLATRQFHLVDARTGQVLEAWDALHHDHGTGVKRDRKSLRGRAGTADDLTRKASGWWRMRSVDDRLVTYDMAGRWGGSLVVARDADNHWTASSQRSAVDAQYYARATDGFLLRRFGFDVLAPACGYGQIRSIVRFGTGYGNAFWNGSQLVYGEGDANFRPLSGAHDVVAHELGHAVTQCTSDLDYLNEPGALNEAFSDILAVAAEFDLAEPLSSNCRRAAGQTGCPDWWIGEDVWRGSGGLGIRNLADPAAGGQPSHYSARYTGSADNGGVHINSGIPGHAFRLLAEGGRNARCSGAHDPAADCDVLVPGVGLAAARAIAFLTYASLPSNAQFCTARTATLAAAEALHPGSTLHRVAAALSWSAVGVADCPPAPGDFRLELGQRSLYLAPGGSGELALSLWRGSEASSIDLSLEGLPSGWYELKPEALSLSLPEDATPGSRPFTLSASSATRSERVHGLLVVDAEGPVVSLVQPSLFVGAVVPVDGGGLPVALDWNALDAGSGLATAVLEWSVDGGDWLDITPAAGPGSRLTLTLGAGAHSFRVRATDEVGNSSSSEASQPITLAGWQEGAASYSAGWSALSTSQAWGTLRSTTETKRRATFTFSGSEVAWVADRGPKRGKVKVYVDGVQVAKIDLFAKKSAARVVVFRASGLSAGVPHSLRIVSLGTTGRPRVGVDGFLVLSR